MHIPTGRHQVNSPGLLIKFNIVEVKLQRQIATHSTPKLLLTTIILQL